MMYFSILSICLAHIMPWILSPTLHKFGQVQWLQNLEGGGGSVGGSAQKYQVGGLPDTTPLGQGQSRARDSVLKEIIQSQIKCYVLFKDKGH